MKIYAANEDNRIVDLVTRYVGKNVWIAVYIVDIFGDYADHGYLNPVSFDYGSLQYRLVFDWEFRTYPFDELISGAYLLEHNKAMLARRYVADSPIDLYSGEDLQDLADSMFGESLDAEDDD